jgi:carbon storage regulator CsrA
MLVLTRKQQEKIRIGDQITITVLRTKGKAVRLGIEAPADIPVIRGELTFQVEPAIAASLCGGDAETAQPMTVEVVRMSGPAGHKGSDWSTKSDRTPVVAAQSQVSFQRVSREQAFPGSETSEAPLRAMMKRRSLSA